MRQAELITLLDNCFHADRTRDSDLSLFDVYNYGFLMEKLMGA